MGQAVALALGGGAALGWAHIGVARALQERGVRIGAVAGTSIGAVVAVSLAAGKLDMIEALARATKPLTPLRYLDVSFRGGMLAGNLVEREVEKHFTGQTLRDLDIPCCVVAADLVTGQSVSMTDAPVALAVRASVAIPGIFRPVAFEGRLLADGGLVSPCPVAELQAISSLPVIAVNLTGDYQHRAQVAGLTAHVPAEKISPIEVTRASIGLLLASLSDAHMALHRPAAVISPKLGHIDVADFTKADELIALGREAVEAVWPSIAALVA